MFHLPVLSLWTKKLAIVPTAEIFVNPYTASVLEGICQRNNIDSLYQESLGSQLGFACEVYNFRSSRRGESLNSKQIRKILDRLKNNSRKLENELERLHPQILLHCFQAEKEL